MRKIFKCCITLALVIIQQKSQCQFHIEIPNVMSHQLIADGSGNGPTLASSDFFGRSVASIGDINNDGIDDIAVGAPGENSGGTDRGAVYICFMNTNGTVKTSPAPVKIEHGSAVTTPSGTLSLANSDFFGCSVAGIGDLNGDGYEDIAVGAYGTTIQGNTTGAVYVLLLNASAAILSYKQITYGSPGFVNLPANCQFGFSLANAGDVNGDGETDIVVGAPAADTGNGTVWLIRLRANGQVKSYKQIKENTNGFDNGTTIAGDNFGFSVTGAGDLNYDGLQDVIVGTPGEDDGYTNAGAFWILYLDSASAILDEKKLSYPLMSNHYYPNISDVSLGKSLRVTDINEDGVNDIIAGIKTFNGSKGGFYFMVMDSVQDIQAIKMISFQYGWTNTGPVTAPQFGADLCEVQLSGNTFHKQYLVGADFYNPLSSSQEGSVYVITMDSLTFDFPAGRVVNYTAITDFSGDFTGVVGNGSNMGADAAVIGDLNDDGIVDLAVGASGTTTGSKTAAGAVFILFMAADGKVSSSVKLEDGLNGCPTLEAGGQFGWGMAPAGDFNNDGIEDLLVGAPIDNTGGTDRGVVYLLYMNTNGTVKSSPAPKKIQTSGLANNDRFGIDLDTIGDLDNDGVVDLAVGVYGSDQGGTDKGAVDIVFMNADGTVKGSHRIGDSDPSFSETFSNNDLFGISVDGIGDFNGDGKEDVLVGCNTKDGKGAAYILYLDTDGEVLGFKKINDVAGNFPYTLRSNNQFANSVQMIPDIDGNGVKDLIISQPSYSTFGMAARGVIWITMLDSLGNVLDALPVADSCGGLYTNMHVTYLFGSSVRYYDTDSLGNIRVVVGARDDGGGSDRGGVMFLTFHALSSASYSQLQKYYAEVEKRLDGENYVFFDRAVHFRYYDKYHDSDDNLSFKIYNDVGATVLHDGMPVPPPSGPAFPVINPNYGENRIDINCNMLPYGSYILEVTNTKKETYYLRFQLSNPGTSLKK